MLTRWNEESKLKAIDKMLKESEQSIQQLSQVLVYETPPSSPPSSAEVVNVKRPEKQREIIEILESDDDNDRGGTNDNRGDDIYDVNDNDVDQNVQPHSPTIPDPLSDYDSDQDFRRIDSDPDLTQPI